MYHHKRAHTANTCKGARTRYAVYRNAYRGWEDEWKRKRTLTTRMGLNAPCRHTVYVHVCAWGGQHLIDKSTNQWLVSLLLEVTLMISNAGQECILMLPSANIYSYNYIATYVDHGILIGYVCYHIICFPLKQFQQSLITLPSTFPFSVPHQTVPIPLQPLHPHPCPFTHIQYSTWTALSSFYFTTHYRVVCIRQRVHSTEYCINMYVRIAMNPLQHANLSTCLLAWDKSI